MESMCRLCLTTANGEDIFKNEFDKVIQEAFGIQLREKSNWPSHACETCTGFLNELTAFKAKIEISQEHLQQLESQVVVKAEPLTEVYENLQDSSFRVKLEAEDPHSPENAEQAGDDFCLKSESEDTPTSERSEQVHEEVRSPPIVSGKKRRTKKKKTNLKELRAPLEKQLKRMNLLNCNKCPFEANALKELQKHYKDQHPTIVFYVSCCKNKYMYLILQIYEHMEYHLDENRFKCKICHKKLRSNMQLQQHRRLSHGNREDWKFECRTCGKQFPTHSRLKAHEQRHNYSPSPRNCNICGRELANEKALKKHINLLHTERKTEECDICGKQFFDVGTHKRLYHGPKATVKCEHCGKEVLKRLYARHVKRMHKNQCNVYECTVCGKEIKWAGNYKTHLETHNGFKYDCGFCNMFITKTKSDFLRHMTLRHPEEYKEFRKNESTKVRTKGTNAASTECP